MLYFLCASSATLRLCGEGLELPADQAPKASPVEMRSRVGLAPRRRGNIGMADDFPDRIPAQEHGRQPGQRRILDVREELIVAAFDLDADGEVIAAPAAVPFGLSGMP